jgi:hypothetical protein
MKKHPVRFGPCLVLLAVGMVATPRADALRDTQVALNQLQEALKCAR